MQENNQIFKDYSGKINEKIDMENLSIDGKDFNNIIILLNWCFQKRNNFFIQDFNKKQIKNICVIYNTMKSNIFSKKTKNIFENLTISQLKALKFILYNYITIFENIYNDNTDLCSKVSKESITKCLREINKLLVVIQ